MYHWSHELGLGGGLPPGRGWSASWQAGGLQQGGLPLPPRYGQPAGGTHPTGVHTCSHPRSQASKGYVFTGVCHCVTFGGGWGERWHQMHHGIGHCDTWGRWRGLGGRWPGWGGGGGCLSPRGQDHPPWTGPLAPPLDRTTPSPTWRKGHWPPTMKERSLTSPPPNIRALRSMRRRAVRILLECILVKHILSLPIFKTRMHSSRMRTDRLSGRHYLPLVRGAHRLSPPHSPVSQKGSDITSHLRLWKHYHHLRSVITSGGFRGGRPPPPRAPKFFRFHAVFGKIWQNRMLAPPPGKSWIRRW